MKQQHEEELFNRYLPLVYKIVKAMKRSLPRHVEEDELVSFGMMGLLDAFRRYSQRDNIKFETYATQRIRGEIYDGLRRNDPLSRTLRKKEKEVMKAFETLEQTLFRQPTLKEVSEFLKMSEKECKDILTQATFEKQTSLDEPVESGEETVLKRDFLSDNSVVDQAKQVEEKERSQILSSLIDELPEKEKIILSLIYEENLSMSEVGRILGLHKSRISQLHLRIIKKLKLAFEKEYN
ncbi:FliA/WhiG family RNA polymerase sigma factor [Neobacillus rhizophilus]|uniref:FliA/WhiG family RNA polymerase sigma factor n=1 Tax=Neobacillus rhizophilus TaxID=2833579 RepID=A0A942YTM0_9BACI|nr:FliA/WhiG family RNA polymerase sigma factor [Neobacillus rhizophilus]MBS4213058.1 FliA/WhiG family RNA polymerase sigma factor [Neobacillus rhizophilus]